MLRIKTEQNSLGNKQHTSLIVGFLLSNFARCNFKRKIYMFRYCPMYLHIPFIPMILGYSAFYGSSSNRCTCIYTQHAQACTIRMNGIARIHWKFMKRSQCWRVSNMSASQYILLMLFALHFSIHERYSERLAVILPFIHCIEYPSRVRFLHDV